MWLSSQRIPIKQESIIWNFETKEISLTFLIYYYPVCVKDELNTFLSLKEISLKWGLLKYNNLFFMWMLQIVDKVIITFF